MTPLAPDCWLRLVHRDGRAVLPPELTVPAEVAFADAFEPRSPHPRTYSPRRSGRRCSSGSARARAARALLSEQAGGPRVDPEYALVLTGFVTGRPVAAFLQLVP